MRATLLLADFAVVADGKLTVVGGGWSITGPQPMPFAIAVKVEVPWDRANQKHRMRLELLDADGQPVLVPTDEGDQQLSIEGEFETGRPPGLKAGTPLDFMFAINLAPQPIAAGQRYQWRLSIDGRTEDSWAVGFTTRPEAVEQVG